MQIQSGTRPATAITNPRHSSRRIIPLGFIIASAIAGCVNPLPKSAPAVSQTPALPVYYIPQSAFTSDRASLAVVKWSTTESVPGAIVSIDDVKFPEDAPGTAYLSPGEHVFTYKKYIESKTDTKLSRLLLEHSKNHSVDAGKVYLWSVLISQLDPEAVKQKSLYGEAPVILHWQFTKPMGQTWKP
jgi:hypothetical protein